MLVTKVFMAIFISVVLAHPICERTFDDETGLKARAGPASSPKDNKPKPVQIGPGGSPTEQMRKQNLAPGRQAPQLCKTQFDCKCPPGKPGQPHSIFCKKGTCVCDDPEVNKTAEFFVKQYLDACAKIGNSAIVKAMYNLLQGFEDAKQVASMIAGAVLGPEAKAAIRIALNAIPSTVPSHIDEATKGIISKVL